MSEPTRLRHSRHSPFERALFEAVEADRVPVEGRRRLLHTLGIAGTVAAVAATTQAAAAAGSAAASGAGAGSATAVGATGAGSLAGMGATTIGKWLGIGLMVGGLTSGAVFVSTDADPPPFERAPVVHVAASPSDVSQPKRVSESAPRELGAAQPPLGDVLGSPPPSAGAVRVAAADATKRDSLYPELLLLDQARSALRNGAPRRSLELLAERDVRFPSGALLPEAQVLRCEALLALGHTREVASAARQFLSEHAASPLAPRVRSLLAQAGVSSPRATESHPSPGAVAPSPNVARFPVE